MPWIQAISAKSEGHEPRGYSPYLCFHSANLSHPWVCGMSKALPRRGRGVGPGNLAWPFRLLRAFISLPMYQTTLEATAANAIERYETSLIVSTA